MFKVGGIRMLCEICKQNNATVHIIKVINGVKQELNLCENCANSSQENDIHNEFKMDTSFTFQNLLGGLVDYINQSSQNNRTTESVCDGCGMTYSEFKRVGLLGCSECYNKFASTIMPVIKRVQGNTEHVGKIPVKSGKLILEKKKLKSLKEELQKSIIDEEYERAAQLRDEIKLLQNGGKNI
jgi:Uncharacterized protein with conserved CXXC pairs